MESLRGPWPCSVAGPLVGAIEYFSCNWKRDGGWNLSLLALLRPWLPH